jgi:soluble lytic murein transglycosylase
MPVATPESRRLHEAFMASAQLRPMAQQLVLTRSAAAYDGVIAYAGSHPGEAAAAANLALGHAYMLDRRYPEAESAFRKVDARGSALADYAEYLAAQAAVKGNRPQDALPLLDHFAERHPGSLFAPDAPVLLATAYIAGGDAGSAIRTLEPLRSGDIGSHVGFRLALAQSYQAGGKSAQAATLYRGIYLGDPLSPEATTAKANLAALGSPLTPAEQKQHADAMFNAKQYGQAATEYRELQKNGKDLSQADRDALEIYAAVCDLRLKRLTLSDVARLPVTGDDSAALKMYLQSELARNMGDMSEQDSLVQQMVTRYPQSRWLEEALNSGGNMYLLKQDRPHAIADYTTLVQHFPHSIYAPVAHWHAAWLSYRLRRYPDAARLMDEQIANYPGTEDIPGALYWRGRLYEDEEHNVGQALNYYNALSNAYANSYYAILARQRIAVIAGLPSKPAAAPPAPVLASVRPLDDPQLTDALPENDPHLIKARLLANAALNEYIRPEIQLSATSAQWGALAEAEIYESFGENTRALQAMKRSKIPFFSLPVAEVPIAYWQLVFPRPYWAELSADAQANGLDPYLVAALIRQESEFDPQAVSRANAVGLMQLLPSVGKSLAKKQGERHFSANELLDPATNLRLGTADLRQSINRYSGQIEYALAAYNAGDTPVHQWIALNDYKDVPEWVESIPYTETRGYVQSILRNREVYRAVYSGR